MIQHMTKRQSCEVPIDNDHKMTTVDQRPGAVVPGAGGAIGASSVGRTFECEKRLVGKLIGPNGAHIRHLERRSNCRIDIDQQVQPCIVTINGNMQADVDSGYAHLMALLKSSYVTTDVLLKS